MRFLFTANALRDYDKLSAHKQALVDKQIFHLLENTRYPKVFTMSLRWSRTRDEAILFLA